LNTINYLSKKFNIHKKVSEFVLATENSVKNRFSEFEKTAEINHYKVISAFQEEKVSPRHFAASTGYGYFDEGKTALSNAVARIFNAESALLSPHILSGTHAISLALFGLLRPLDAFISVTGRPYDTLCNVIGGENTADTGSITDFAIRYLEVPLTAQGEMNVQKARNMLEVEENVKLAYIQRSRGYSWRRSFSVDDIATAIGAIKEARPDIIVAVDNCYGEFCELKEPVEAGADIVIGSLIKNMGGGIAPNGGYIAGKKRYIDMIANRLTAPGLGNEIGAYASSYLPFFQGLYLAPATVCEALKGAELTAYAFERLGFATFPVSSSRRPDITQSVRMNDKARLLAYCRGIQKASPIDSHVTPVPWDMPGYKHDIVMAAGTFIQGSSIELSADAPVKPPYIVYVQGGLTYTQHKLGLIFGLNEMLNEDLITL